MNIRTQLELEEHFTDSEKEIARYILAHGKEVVKDSISILAEKTYTSPATIVRLTKKIGLKGYNDFRIRYSAELEKLAIQENEIDVNFPFTKEDSYENIMNNLTTLSNQTLEHTQALLDEKDLRKIVALMKKARVIDLYGTENSLLAAALFQNKMTRIGKNVDMRSLDGSQTFLASASAPDHLAIVISYSGETETVIRWVQILKRKHTPLVAITSLGDNQLSRYADIILRIDTREKLFNKIAPFSSIISFEYILSVIYSFYFQEDYEGHLERKISFDQMSDKRPAHLLKDEND
ncbi:MurR/RpiR family transcriptional regulator [Sharpea azabuensis]|uniref:MurR/RpiR family transcriptional regulator n=1 Tax=Sharpea azabuensis TaxID=322505 RepID=UPI0013D9784F|nr:MurR/RpiR family transcriptional regulator [Sharpea azabuensis]